MGKVGMALAATLLATAANAASFTWDFQNTAALPTHTFLETAIGGSGVIRMSAFSTTGTTSTWTAAQFTNQGTSGLGITHTGELTGPPEHAIDSITNQDIVVIDAGAGSSVDWTSLMIGYGVDNQTAGACCSLIANNQADIRLWTGNTLNTATATISSLTSPAFQNSLLDNVTVGSNRGVDTGTGGNLSPSRYLVISGNINDAFKLKNIVGSSGSPPGQTPEPASIALLGLGLLGFAFARKRRTV